MSQTKAELIKGLNINASAPATALNIDSSGRVGIGTSSFTPRLAVNNSVNGGGYGDPNSYYAAAENTGVYGLTTINSGSLTASKAQAGVIGVGRVNASGAPGSGNEVYGVLGVTSNSYGGGVNAFGVGCIGDGYISGRLGIGTTAPSYALDVALANDTYILARETTSNIVNGFRIAGPNNEAKAIFSANSATGEVRLGGINTNYFQTFYTNNTERARIDSSGRFLVGTSTARSVAGQTHLVQLETVGSSPFGGISAINNANNNNGSYLILGKSRGTSVGSNTIVQNGDQLGGVFFAAADGNGVNAYSGAITCEIDAAPSAGDTPGRLVFSTTADGASSPTERFRVTSAGNTLFGCTSSPNSSVRGVQIPDKLADYAFIVSAGSATTTFGMILFYNGNGIVGQIVTNGSATAYNTSSDYRLKKNVIAVTDGITRLQQLKPSRFNFITDPDKTIDGFLAHEAQAVVPECVTGTKDEVDADGNPVYQGIDQSKLVPLLTAALQEAVAKIESLEARLTAAGI